MADIYRGIGDNNIREIGGGYGRYLLGLLG